jgi:hypothetical protein
MSNIQKTGVLLLLLLAVTSCKNKDNYTAYFGGEISNPRSEYVIFSKGNKIIDTIPLKENNRFFIKFDSLTPGLYTFRHDPEYQYVYFDKNDSIMVFADSKDFDQSVVFSGRGERKNNFMMELYLTNEKDREATYDFYGLEYRDFQRKIDSAYALRNAFYKQKKDIINWSEGFDFYAKSRLNFNHYTKKEYYPYLYARRNGKEIASKLPAGYYSHRSTIDFNDPKLTDFSPFARYITAMMNNMAITRAQKKADNVQENTLRDNITKLKIADSLFTNEKIKNQVLNNIAFSYLLEDQNIINNQQFLERYMELSTDNSNDNSIHKIANAIKNLEKGNELPEIPLVLPNNKPFDIDDDVKKQSVVFFWTSCAHSHLEMVYMKINELKKQFPDVDFIAINVDESKEWKKVMSQYKFKGAIQLRAANFEELKDKWVITKINRTIVLNPDGSIKNAFTNLMNPDFAAELK